MKKFIFAIVCIFTIILSISPLFVFAEDLPEFDPYENVTVGIYENGNIVVSDEYAFNNSYILSLGDAIYNYYYALYGDNSNYPTRDEIYDDLYSLFPQGFLNSCAENKWLMNAYANTHNSIDIIFSRSPKSIDTTGIFMNTSLGGGVDFNFEPSGVASSVWFASNPYTNSSARFNLMGYVPYFTFHLTDDQYINNSTIRKRNELSHETLTNFTSALSNDNIRCFQICIGFTYPSFTPTLFDYNGYNLQYVNYSTSEYAYGLGSMYHNKHNRSAIEVKDTLVSMFPIFYMDIKNPFEVGSFFGDGSVTEKTFTASPNNLVNEFEPNADLNIPIISSYSDIPISPVQSPTPIPTFTPMPTAVITLVPSPSPIPPVNVVEGLGQMFTLFTRKYSFTINGAEIGIRPLYLFLACFFVGMIFRVFQGGNSE